MIFGIDNHNVTFLFSVIYIKKETYRILCNNFTYQHEPQTITSLVK